MHYFIKLSGLLLVCILVQNCISKRSSTDVEADHNSVQNTKGENIVIDGYIQGTTYHIIYQSKKNEDYRDEIGSILNVFNKTASVYDSTSLISRINRNEPNVIVNSMFKEIFNRSMEISVETNGMFDITVGPIVRAWGFGPDTSGLTTDQNIDSLLQFVGYNKVKIKDNRVVKDVPGVILDFNAIAQGYSVDLVSNYLKEMGLHNYLVEIGGEVYCSGLKNNSSKWRIGVDKPVEGNMVAGQNIQAVISLSDKALATSGNYRKFYFKEGVKYSHSINPKTGRPAMHNLLSATVIADDCMTADAFATAFMVMGLERSIEFLKSKPELDALLIYSDSNNEYAMYKTEGMQEILENY
ncbi:MAG: FAD:protein FMN transferase [Bacteroidales bacterium]|nr:FAD:protein FMN transferase [Bacteroidales bacterium]